MENITVTMSAENVQDALNKAIGRAISEAMSEHAPEIERKVADLFSANQANNWRAGFDKGLDWALEFAFREGIHKAMEEMGFKEMIAQEAKKVLSDSAFIRELAEAKVRASLGLDTSEKD